MKIIALVYQHTEIGKIFANYCEIPMYYIVEEETIEWNSKGRQISNETIQLNISTIFHVNWINYIDFIWNEFNYAVTVHFKSGE